MKKFILSLVLIVLFFIGMPHIPSAVAQQDTNKQATMRDVKFAFCNDGLDKTTSTLNSAIKQGTPFKVCAVRTNNSDVDAKIHVDIADVSLTTQGSKSCELTTNFEQFIDKEDLKSLKDFTIPAKNNVIKEFNITFPIGIDGKQEGCFAYNVVKENDNAMLGVVIRSATWMDFFVGNIDNIKNEFKVEDTNIALDQNKDLIMNFNLKNIGNLENDVIISGEITNIFGFSKSFGITAGNITPDQTLPVNINLGSIPSYGGLFNINITMNATPYFAYDISNSNIDPTLIETKEFNIITTYFQAPRLIIGILILIIILLILAFRKPKQKVVYVQQPTPNV